MSGASYAAAGVDVEAGERAVALMRASVAAAQRPETVGSFGGFAGLFDASALTKYRKPLLATSTDGVGTKVAVAQALDIHNTVGIDLVAMIVDDLVVCGAEPWPPTPRTRMSICVDCAMAGPEVTPTRPAGMPLQSCRAMT